MTAGMAGEGGETAARENGGRRDGEKERETQERDCGVRW